MLEPPRCTQPSISGPTWSPNGRLIAYQREDSCAPGSGQPQGTLSIGVIGSDGSDHAGIGTQNTSYDVGAWFYAWSPNSAQLAFLDDEQDSTGHIYLSVASPFTSTIHHLNKDADLEPPPGEQPLQHTDDRCRGTLPSTRPGEDVTTYRVRYDAPTTARGLAGCEKQPTRHQSRRRTHRRPEDQQEREAEGQAQQAETDRLCVVPNDAAILEDPLATERAQASVNIHPRRCSWRRCGAGVG